MPESPMRMSLFIPPGKRSHSTIPFTAYDYFQRAMDGCGCCIVIGYSFRDYDALTKLMSASILNQRLTVLVIDPNSDAVAERLDKYHLKNRASVPCGTCDERYLSLSPLQCVV